MGQTRRFRTLVEVGPADRFDTIADLRHDEQIVTLISNSDAVTVDPTQLGNIVMLANCFRRRAVGQRPSERGGGGWQ